MSQPTFSCYIRRERDALYLVFEGAIDIATAPDAQSALQRFTAEHGPTVVLDMSRVNFIDSRGVGALIFAAKAARDAGGLLYLQRPAIPVVKILETCGLTSLFPPPPESIQQPPAAEAPVVSQATRAARPRAGAAARAATARR